MDNNDNVQVEVMGDKADNKEEKRTQLQLQVQIKLKFRMLKMEMMMSTMTTIIWVDDEEEENYNDQGDSNGNDNYDDRTMGIVNSAKNTPKQRKLAEKSGLFSLFKHCNI